MRRSPLAATAAVTTLLLAACFDGQGATAPGFARPATPATRIATVSCTGSVTRHALACGEQQPDVPAGAAAIMYGGQGHYVQLTSSNIAIDADTFAFDVTVQNLIPQAIGTADGVTLDSAGVRVFFDAMPYATSGSGALDVVDIGGTATYTATHQPYYQFDEVLAQNQTSAPMRFKLTFEPGVDGFAFRVYVAAPVLYPHGWVDVAPSTPYLLAGGVQSLTGVVRTALGDTAADQSITWQTSDGSVLGVDGAGNASAIAPGAATISATAGLAVGTMTMSVCPDIPVGGTYVATFPAAAATCLGGTASTAEYAIVPINGSTSSRLSLSATATGSQAVTGPPAIVAADLRSALASWSSDPAASGFVVGGDASPALAGAGRGAALQDARPVLTLGAKQKITAAGAPIARAITPGVPVVGDLVSLNVAQGCSGAADLRTGRVRTVSQRAIIVGDTANPAGGFTTAQYDSIALEFDSLSFKVDSANFGAPTDVDGNGRTVIFYTRAVNELSPPATAASQYGYFWNRDVFSTDPVNGCERSNAGEILYMMVPDPTGAVNSNVRTVSAVRGNGSRTHAHELEHLINAFRRVYVTGATAFEEPWLDEALATEAEELMFYRTAPGLAPRGNIVLSNLNTGPTASRRVAAYNTYMNNTFTNLRSWLQRPDTAGVLTADVGLAAKGFTASFLRYASDRVNGSEPAFWQSLVNSNLEGMTNVQNAIGGDPLAWLNDFQVALYADDNAFTVGSAYRTPSWNYRSVYGGLGGFPLLVRPLASGTPLTLSYGRFGGSSYLRMGTAAGSFADLTLLSGGTVPTSPFRLTVIRTK